MSFAVQQGRAPLSMRKDDLYETPPQATHALCRAINVSGLRIWEPACGRGAISEVLKEYGAQVLSTDLVDYGYGECGRDFLLEFGPCEVDAIITNPPFKLADAFVRQALALAPRAIMLLRWAYAEGAGRSDIIDRHLSHVWLGRERLPFMHRDGYDGPKNANSGAPFAWFVFDRQRRIQDGFTVSRISWRS